MTGRLVAVVGPSGAGKDTLLAALLARRADLILARRVITRPFDPGAETHEPVSRDTFAARLAEGAFLFHWQAHGLSYGIPRTVLTKVAAVRTVLFNGSRAALPQARKAFPALEVVMITAPVPILEARLVARDRESASDIAARLDRAALTVPEGARVVLNDASLAEGIARLEAALSPAADA